MPTKKAPVSSSIRSAISIRLGNAVGRRSQNSRSRAASASPSSMLQMGFRTNISCAVSKTISARARSRGSVGYRPPPIVVARNRMQAPLCAMTVAFSPSTTCSAGSCSVGEYTRFSSRVLFTKSKTSKVSSSMSSPPYRHIMRIGSASARTEMYWKTHQVKHRVRCSSGDISDRVCAA